MHRNLKITDELINTVITGKDFLTTKEVANLLQLNISSVQHDIIEKKIISIKIDTHRYIYKYALLKFLGVAIPDEMLNCEKTEKKFKKENMNKIKKEIKEKKERQEKRVRKSSTLCWYCLHSYKNQCSWAKELKPVKGWNAKEDYIEKTARAGTNRVRSYFVIDCPEFERG